MLSAHRHDTILKRLEINGRIRAIEMAHELVVSEETIRRDLTELKRWAGCGGSMAAR